MKNKKENNQKVVRPTVAFLENENKMIEHYCIDLDITKGEFLKQAALHCVKNKIDPR
jgi:hypothetical protein